MTKNVYQTKQKGGNMKGLFGTTVSEEAVSKVVNSIMEIAQTEEDSVTLEVILTAVEEVKKVFATDAEIKKRPPKRSNQNGLKSDKEVEK